MTATRDVDERAARFAFRRQLMLAGGFVLLAAALAVVVVLLGVPFGAVDRPLLVVGGIAAISVFRAVRTANRVRKQGIGAALAQPPEPAEASPRTDLDARDAFHIVQRFRLFGARYEVHAADALIATVELEPFKAREEVLALTPEPRRLFALRAQQILDLGGRYRVDDSGGRRIGELRNRFTRSIVRSSWEVWDGDGTLVATAEERSVPVALFRRVIDFLPLPYHFDVRDARTQERLATLTRRRTLRDRYVLDLAGDPHKKLDRRLALALAVALDALQSR